jgi:hypothetical protein
MLHNRRLRPAVRPQFVLVALRLEPFAVSGNLVALLYKIGWCCGRSSPTGRDAHSFGTIFTFCNVTPHGFVDIYVPTFRLSHFRTGFLLR